MDGHGHAALELNLAPTLIASHGPSHDGGHQCQLYYLFEHDWVGKYLDKLLIINDLNNFNQ
jgi:hypothetical protein